MKEKRVFCGGEIYSRDSHHYNPNYKFVDDCDDDESTYYKHQRDDGYEISSFGEKKIKFCMYN